jgi:gamma-glutamylputrescine oxidase
MVMASQTCLASDFKTTPYWWDAAPPESSLDTPVPGRADVVVIGSGYCGLSAAIELAQAGMSVAVLEAGELGVGASTRSGGMVTGGQKFVVSGALKNYPQERAQRILEDAKASLEHLEALIGQHSLAADYVKSGRLIAAHTPRHYRHLERWADILSRHTDAIVSLVPRKHLREEIGGSCYFGGLLIENYGGLHPAKYHQSLRRVAVRCGITLCSHAAVNRIDRLGVEFRIGCSRGSIRAKFVIVATNGYSHDALPFLRRRIIPVASYIIASEPLSPALTRVLSPKGRMFSDTRRNLYYFRLSPDGTRVVFGARPAGRELDESSAAPRMFRLVCKVWPQLAHARITHCWRGNVGMTFDHVPHMGAHEGVHYAAGCNGSGVAMMTFLGCQTALKILGRQNRPCAFESDNFPQRLYYHGRPWFVPVVAAYHRVRDRVDRRVMRRP